MFVLKSCTFTILVESIKRRGSGLTIGIWIQKQHSSKVHPQTQLSSKGCDRRSKTELPKPQCQNITLITVHRILNKQAFKHIPSPVSSPIQLWSGFFLSIRCSFIDYARTRKWIGVSSPTYNRHTVILKQCWWVGPHLYTPLIKHVLHGPRFIHWQLTFSPSCGS